MAVKKKEDVLKDLTRAKTLHLKNCQRPFNTYKQSNYMSKVDLMVEKSMKNYQGKTKTFPLYDDT